MTTISAVSGPRSIGDVLDGAFRIFRAHFGSLIFTTALFLVPVGILSGLLTGSYMTSMQDMMMAAEVMDSTGSNALLGDMINSAVSTFGLVLLLSALMMVATGLVNLTLTVQVLAILAAQPLAFEQALRRAMGRFGAWLGMALAQYGAITGITMGLVLVVGIAAFILVFGAGLVWEVLGLDGGSFSAVAFAATMLAVLCAYLFLLILLLAPAAYLSTRWVAAVPGLVDQRLGPVQSLRASWRLTRRLVWRSLIFTVLLSVLGMLITTAPMLVLQQIMLAVLPFDPATVAAISTALGSITSILWQPLYAAAAVLYYFDLRVRQESYDLSLRIQAVEAQAQEAQLQP